MATLNAPKGTSTGIWESMKAAENTTTYAVFFQLHKCGDKSWTIPRLSNWDDQLGAQLREITHDCGWGLLSFGSCVVENEVVDQLNKRAGLLTEGKRSLRCVAVRKSR